MEASEFPAQEAAKETVSSPRNWTSGHKCCTLPEHELASSEAIFKGERLICLREEIPRQHSMEVVVWSLLKLSRSIESSRWSKKRKETCNAQERRVSFEWETGQRQAKHWDHRKDHHPCKYAHLLVCTFIQTGQRSSSNNH